MDLLITDWAVLPAPGQWRSISDAAGMLNLSKTEIRKRIADGQIPARQDGRRRTFVHVPQQSTADHSPVVRPHRKSVSTGLGRPSGTQVVRRLSKLHHKKQNRRHSADVSVN
jgi:hypothetical protein